MKYLKLYEQFDSFDPFGEEKNSRNIEDIMKKIENEKLNIYKTKHSYFVEDDKNPPKEIYVISKYHDKYYFGGRENDIEIEELISAEDYVKIEELYMRYGKEEPLFL